MQVENQSAGSRDYIRELYLLMQLSRKGYAKYMQNKIYLHALTIRAANRRIYSHIINNLSRLPEPLQDDALDLLNHYDIWMAQFREYEAGKKPALADPFIFHHLDAQSAFPKLAEQRIFDYYLSLNEQKINNE
jgi:hypothetical protein